MVVKSDTIPPTPHKKAITLQPDVLEYLLLSLWARDNEKRVHGKEEAAAEMLVMHKN